MDEFTTAAQEPFEALAEQEPFEALADRIREAIADFVDEYSGIVVLDILQALNDVNTGFLHADDEDDEDDDEDDDEEDDEGEV